jgi:hypothetical protein
MKKSAYIITKPLQYINATNIEDENLKDCYLEDNFNSFDLFVNSIRSKSSHWDKIYVCKTKQLGLFKIILNRRKYSKVYLDSDVGILVRLSLFLLFPLKVYVYEEGFASYTAAYRGKKTYKDIVLSLVDKILCGKNWSGGSASTTGVFLYHKNAFRNIVSDTTSKQLLDFKSKFSDHLMRIPEINFLFNGIDFELFRNQKVLLYLSSWEINKDLNFYIDKYPDYIKIIKPHPHIKELTYVNDNFNHVIANMLPAEIVISEIVKVAKECIVVHEGSAAMMTFKESDNFKEYNINTIDNRQKYDELKKMFI